MPNLNPKELADRIENLSFFAPNLRETLQQEDVSLLAAALRLADAAADPNFPRLELGKLRAKYIEARGA